MVVWPSAVMPMKPETSVPRDFETPGESKVMTFCTFCERLAKRKLIWVRNVPRIYGRERRGMDFYTQAKK